jgi:L-rhamnose mutarotase
MQRICFMLQVKPQRLEEYKQRHRTVWPAMQAALHETGWGNCSLFLRDDGLLVFVRPARWRAAGSCDATSGRSISPLIQICSPDSRNS